MTNPQPWTQSFSGKKITSLDLQIESVSFKDIPHALAQKVRFNGHLNEMGYSVAQHCVIGAHAIEEPFKLAFLLHELSEVYLPDVPAPIKPFVQVQTPKGVISWSELEDIHLKAMLSALGLSALEEKVHSPEVKLMDARMLTTEKRDLMGPPSEDWQLKTEPLKDSITWVWTPWAAKEQFRKMYERLRASWRP